MTETTLRVVEMRGDEEAFLWATAALGEARRHTRRRTNAALEAVVEDLAFGLGARSFPPDNARASRYHRPARLARAT